MVRKQKKGGFTLVELIVVIVVLGILAAVAVPSYNGYIKKAREAGDLQLLGALNNAYAAVCEELGINRTSGMGHARLDNSGKVTEVTFPGHDEFNAEFFRLFEGNEDKQFEQIQVLGYDQGNGVFVGYSAGETVYLSATIGGQEVSLTVSTDDLAAYHGSVYSELGSAELMGDVNTVVTALSNLEGTSLESVLNNLTSKSGFEAFLKTRLGMNDEQISAMSNTAKSNAMVLMTASESGKLNEVDANKILSFLDTEKGTLETSKGGRRNQENLFNDKSKLDLVTTTALTYALAMGYANSDNAPIDATIKMSSAEYQQSYKLAGINPENKEYITEQEYFDALYGSGCYELSKNTADDTYTIKLNLGNMSSSDYFAARSANLSSNVALAKAQESALVKVAMNSSGWSNYQSTQAETDLNGYLGALNMLDGAVTALSAEDNTGIINKILNNGFNDPDVVSMLQQMTGS